LIEHVSCRALFSFCRWRHCIPLTQLSKDLYDIDYVHTRSELTAFSTEMSRLIVS
jgi:hypothetical protein